MHSRLKELLEQATTSIKDEYGHWIGSELDEEKFAELIVRECIKAYNDDGYQTEYEQDLKVLKHFGIEQ